MTQPNSPLQQRVRVRKLNVGRVKGNIVGAATAVIGAFSALTGLAPQAAFVPAVTWMLGFSADKATASGTVFAAVVALAVVATAGVTHGLTVSLLGNGFLLAVSATIGAMMGISVGRQLKAGFMTRIGPAIGTLVTLGVLIQVAHLSQWDPTGNLAHWNGWGGLAALGLIAGLAGQVLALPAGLLLVPELYFLAGEPARASIVLSLCVILLASLLPAMAAARGLADSQYRFTWAGGGVVGGIIGSVILARPFMNGKPALMLFAVYGMFLCARELARQAASRSVSS